MKHRDPIVEELHKIRRRMGRAHGFDVHRIAATIRRREANLSGKMDLVMTSVAVFPNVDRHLLDEVVRRIRSVGSPRRIVLFGSHARGQARPHSDLDLLIVEDSDLPRYRRSPRYLRALVGIFPAKDVIVWTPAEIASWSNVQNSFISTILRDGVTLYER